MFQPIGSTAARRHFAFFFSSIQQNREWNHFSVKANRCCFSTLRVLLSGREPETAEVVGTHSAEGSEPLTHTGHRTERRESARRSSEVRGLLQNRGSFSLLTSAPLTEASVISRWTELKLKRQQRFLLSENNEDYFTWWITAHNSIYSRHTLPTLCGGGQQPLLVVVISIKLHIRVLWLSWSQDRKVLES